MKRVILPLLLILFILSNATVFEFGHGLDDIGINTTFSSVWKTPFNFILTGETVIVFNYDAYQKDLDYLKIAIKSQIARDLWGNEGSYAVFVNFDEQFLKAITLFDEAIQLSELNK